MTENRTSHFFYLLCALCLKESVVLDDSGTLVSTVNQGRAGCLENAAFLGEHHHESMGLDPAALGRLTFRV